MDYCLWCDASGRSSAYEPLTLAALSALLADADESQRWRLIAKFLEEYRWEAADVRPGLLMEVPPGTGG